MAEFDLRRPAIGWPLFAVPDAHGRLDWPVLERSVRDTLQALLATRPGEQLMRPDFGAGLDRLLHEPNTLATRRRIQVLVTEAVTRWEPRIVLDRVDVLEVDGEPTQIRVEIAYRLQRTGEAATLALTMTQEPR